MAKIYTIESGVTGPDWLDTMPKGSDYYSQVIAADGKTTEFFDSTPQGAFNKALTFIDANKGE